jgi:hypothetical protein
LFGSSFTVRGAVAVGSHFSVFGRETVWGAFSVNEWLAVGGTFLSVVSGLRVGSSVVPMLVEKWGAFMKQ